MSVFLEEACELETLKKCNLEVFNSRLVSEERTKKFFIVKRHYERAEPTARNRMVHSITDTLDLTEDGHAFISSGDFVDKEVYKLVLRCGGGNLRGKLSGSNCIRVASRAGWCSGVGQCEDWCTFLKQPDSRNRLQHMCNFTVTLIATLHDIKEGRRRIYIEGNHGYPKTSDWLPPTILRPTVHIREHAVKTGISIKGPSASNILCTMVNSPSGESSRSYLSRSVYCKHVENYRRCKYIVCICTHCDFC